MPHSDRSSRRRPLVSAGVTAIVTLGLACAGCGAGADQSAAPDSAGASSSAPESAAPQTDSSTTTPTTTTQPQGAQFPECKAADLNLSTAEGSGGGMSHVGIVLRFANKSGRTCTLQGSPGVSFVDAGGQQIGQPATRAPRTDGKQVVLRPTAGVDSQLLITSPGPFDPAQCKATQASGFRVYAPNDTAAMFVASPQQTCSGLDRPLLQVGVVGG